MNINKFIVNNRLIRRAIVFAFVFQFLRVTNAIFFTGSVCLSPSMNIAYSTFAGLILFILKFYFQGKEDEWMND